jgi:hypothetical protein
MTLSAEPRGEGNWRGIAGDLSWQRESASYFSSSCFPFYSLRDLEEIFPFRVSSLTHTQTSTYPGWRMPHHINIHHSHERHQHMG